MSLTDCAELVKQADEDRFLSVMAAKPEFRAALFALYAFNIEISKAAWASAEPMLCQMRLQYLRDVVDAIYAGEILPNTPVAEPLSDVIMANALPQQKLIEMIEARSWDVQQNPFENITVFSTYLQHTGGNLMELSARATGVNDSDLAAVHTHGTSMGLAKFLIAVPELIGHGCAPLLDETPTSLSELARVALAQLKEAKPPKNARAALLAGFDTKRVLKLVQRAPERVLEGRLRASPFRRRTSLLITSIRG